MIRLAVRVKRRQAELVLAELLELVPGGVEEVDVSPEVVEYAVYGAPGELPAVPDLRAAAGGACVEVSSTEIADDWAERWRDFHRPLVLGDRLTVRPPWEPPTGTGLDTVIDPGQAFGTGSHATTRLCLELMLECDHRGSFADVGCGSGVLAIVAAQLGFDPVIALDYDPAAVTATRENAVRNNVAIDARRLDLRHEQVPAVDTAAANVLGGPLIGWAAHQRELPGTLILGGLLVTEAGAVAAAYAARGMNEVQRRTAGEWAGLLVRAMV